MTRSTKRIGLDLPQLLVTTIVGVYSLLMLGAFLAVSDGLAACSGWPTCNGQLFVGPGDPASIAWAHRLIAAIVLVLLLWVVILAWKSAVPRRVRFILLGALVVYPFQAGVGAAAALGWTGTLQSVLHVSWALLIFGMLVLGLAWVLEHRYGTDETKITSSSSSEPHSPKSADENVLPNPSSRARAYFALMKPRLMWLLCLVAAAGMALAAGPSLRLSTVIATLSGGVLAIGASGTFNHVLERDVDQRMRRTADRPIATSAIPIRNAIAFGILLAVASVAIFVLFVNWLAAALGLAAIVFYSVVYTLILKPNTVQNTVIGGIAGALPAVIGWAAVTGNLGLPAVILAAVIFCWTPAHFYNLAMAYADDYAKGEFPMLPIVRGHDVARKHVLLYAAVTMMVVVGLAMTGTLGWLFAVAAIAAGGGFMVMIVSFHKQRTDRAAMRTFHASNAYLGILLVIMTIDAVVF